MNTEEKSALLNEIDCVFASLENVISNKLITMRAIESAQYDEAIGVLTIEKSELESRLLAEAKKCERWRVLCREILQKLNCTIEAMKSILESRVSNINGE